MMLAAPTITSASSIGDRILSDRARHGQEAGNTAISGAALEELQTEVKRIVASRGRGLPKKLPKPKRRGSLAGAAASAGSPLLAADSAVDGGTTLPPPRRKNSAESLPRAADSTDTAEGAAKGASTRESTTSPELVDAAPIAVTLPIDVPALVSRATSTAATAQAACSIDVPPVAHPLNFALNTPSASPASWSSWGSPRGSWSSSEFHSLSAALVTSPSRAFHNHSGGTPPQRATRSREMRVLYTRSTSAGILA
jgi:hypothetical protein